MFILYLSVSYRVKFRTKLQWVVFHSSLREIRDDAFDPCASLEEVTIEADSQLASVDKDAFKNTCVKVSALPTSLREICEGTFQS